ncbi:MAG: hypothetical protein E6J14_00375 [Chloroflexi bacterium]|nr:MAG: hypothetical protein E6J14_00375 [Chloroflexota bacterium]
MSGAGGRHARIEVQDQGGGLFRVRIATGGEHTVRASPVVLSRVARPGELPAGTVERAFVFLLEREPPGSILRSFALEDIARYFPEFWTEMTTS